MTKSVTVASAALSLVVLGLLLLGLPEGPAGASHEAPDADGTIDYVALDADPTNNGGNDATSLGDPQAGGVPQFDRCVDVATSTSFDIDIVVDAVPDVADPSVDGFSGQQYIVAFDDSNLTFNSASYFFLLASVAGSSVSPIGSAYVLQASGPRVIAFGVIDMNATANEEAAQGIGARLNFTSGSADALAIITLLPSFEDGYKAGATKMLQADGGLFPIGNMGGSGQADLREVTVAIGTAGLTNTDSDNETAGFRFGTGAPPPLLPGDGVTDACDTDDDNDGFSDADERVIFGVSAGSAEELTPCRTDTVDDPWPPDTFPEGTPDRLVDGQDQVEFLPALFKGFGEGGYSVRLDIFQPGAVIDGQDLVALLPFLFKTCQAPP